MKTFRALLSLCVALLTGSATFAGWETVQPRIQLIEPITVNPIVLNGRVIRIYYVSENMDSALAWTAGELQSRLDECEGVLTPSVELIKRWREHPYYEASDQIVYLGLWEDLHADPFQEAEVPFFDVAPEPEGYYIIAKDHNTFLTATTVRGMNYAVTSLWKAVDQQAQTSSLKKAVVVDYPFFPKRQVSKPHPTA
jgi:hypothetical protein